MSEPAYSQYRLDTLIAGAICAKAFASKIIPGKSLSPSQRNSKEAESEAGLYSCLESEGFALGIRLRCWFKPLLNL
ncbi:MAG: hypothetical protein EOP10_00075 [Proteobacteria bacterium]|nr:MAG: hypothetical protein EOP10_00075 [Pseudomonadota bacterium]